MKKNASFIVFLFAVVFFIASILPSPLSKKEFVSSDKDRLLIELISYVLDRGHFTVKALNDDMSLQIFHTYIESLDGQKRYFVNHVFID